MGRGGFGHAPGPPKIFQSFSFKSICMLEIGLGHFLEGGGEGVMNISSLF